MQPRNDSVESLATPGLRAGCEPRCRGCAHRKLSYAESLEHKVEFLRACLKEHPLDPGGFGAAPICAVESAGEENRYAYRMRSLLHAEWDATQGRYRFGVRRPYGAEPGSREVLPIPHCPVHHPELNRLWKAISATCDLNLEEALHVVGVTLRDSGVYEIRFSIRRALKPPSARPPSALLQWAQALAQRLEAEGFASGSRILAHFDPSAGHRIWGVKNWWDLLKGVASEPPVSFEQGIPALHARALEQAAQALWRGAAAVRAGIDLYCGSGDFLNLFLEEVPNAVGLGVEISPAAAAAEQLGRPVLKGRVAERLPQLSAFVQGHGESFWVYLNPPRSGLEPGVVDWLVEHASRIRALAYLSCSPRTLARDLSELEMKSCKAAHAPFSLERLIPYDFFPNTSHLEVLALVTGPASSVAIRSR